VIVTRADERIVAKPRPRVFRPRFAGGRRGLVERHGVRDLKVVGHRKQGHLQIDSFPRRAGRHSTRRHAEGDRCCFRGARG
jgi:hypothetical protein